MKTRKKELEQQITGLEKNLNMLETRVDELQTALDQASNAETASRNEADSLFQQVALGERSTNDYEKLKVKADEQGAKAQDLGRMLSVVQNQIEAGKADIEKLRQELKKLNRDIGQETVKKMEADFAEKNLEIIQKIFILKGLVNGAMSDWPSFAGNLFYGGNPGFEQSQKIRAEFLKEHGLNL